MLELDVAEPVEELGGAGGEPKWGGGGVGGGVRGQPGPEAEELGGAGVTPPPLSSLVKPQQLRGHEGVSMQQQWDGDGVGGGVPQVGLGQKGSTYPFDPGKRDGSDAVGEGYGDGRGVELVGEETSSSGSSSSSGARSFPFDPGKQACYIFQLSCWWIQGIGYSWSVVLCLCFSVSWPAYLSKDCFSCGELVPWYDGSQLCVWLNGNWVGERTFPFDPGKSTIGWYVCARTAVVV